MVSMTRSSASALVMNSPSRARQDRRRRLEQARTGSARAAMPGPAPPRATSVHRRGGHRPPASTSGLRSSLSHSRGVLRVQVLGAERSRDRGDVVEDRPRRGGSFWVLAELAGIVTAGLLPGPAPWVRAEIYCVCGTVRGYRGGDRRRGGGAAAATGIFPGAGRRGVGRRDGREPGASAPCGGAILRAELAGWPSGLGCLPRELSRGDAGHDYLDLTVGTTSAAGHTASTTGISARRHDRTTGPEPLLRRHDRRSVSRGCFSCAMPVQLTAGWWFALCKIGAPSMSPTGLMGAARWLESSTCRTPSSRTRMASGAPMRSYVLVLAPTVMAPPGRLRSPIYERLSLG